MSRIRWNMERASMLATRFVADHWGEQFPFYYVMEFPKSGGSWLADMIADYLQIPRPLMPVFPLGFRCVVHSHWSYSPKLHRVFYLIRDGRDVAVSGYFRAIGEIQDPPYASTRAYFRGRFPSLFDPSIDLTSPRETLPRFIEEWVRHPGGTTHTWPDHVAQWAFDRPHVVLIRYEDLLKDAAGVLSRAIPVHSGEPTDPERLEATVRKFTFERQSGRRAGQEVRGAILRKGVAGDWRNHFTRRAGEVVRSPLRRDARPARLREEPRLGPGPARAMTVSILTSPGPRLPRRHRLGLGRRARVPTETSAPMQIGCSSAPDQQPGLEDLDRFQACAFEPISHGLGCLRIVEFRREPVEGIE